MDFQKASHALAALQEQLFLAEAQRQSIPPRGVSSTVGEGFKALTERMAQLKSAVLEVKEKQN
ncbi:MAG: hypothetical protein ACFCUI_12370 [Bernardetiaceae bacterium]